VAFSNIFMIQAVMTINPVIRYSVFWAKWLLEAQGYSQIKNQIGRIRGFSMRFSLMMPYSAENVVAMKLWQPDP